MASISKGANVHVFGIGTGTFTDAVVMSVSLSDSFNNSTEVKDEIGNVIEERMDDIHTTGDITLKFEAAYTPIAMGGQFTYDSVIYYLTGRSLARTHDGHAEWSYNFKTSEYITLS